MQKREDRILGKSHLILHPESTGFLHKKFYRWDSKQNDVDGLKLKCKQTICLALRQ